MNQTKGDGNEASLDHCVLALRRETVDGRAPFSSWNEGDEGQLSYCGIDT